MNFCLFCVVARRFRLLDVCHGPKIEREGQLVLFLVFEHLEQDLAGYIDTMPVTGMPVPIVQVCFMFYDFII